MQVQVGPYALLPVPLGNAHWGHDRGDLVVACVSHRRLLDRKRLGHGRAGRARRGEWARTMLNLGSRGDDDGKRCLFVAP